MKHLKELFAYRHMVGGLVKRDLRGRYKGSVLGFLWTFINPLMQLVIFTLVFSVIMKAGYDQYYLFLFVALIPWLFFSTSVQDGAICILREKDLIKKIYFPREVMPVAAVSGCFVNMLLTFIIIFVALIVSGRGVNPLALLYLPLVMIVEYILCLGIALIVSALTVYFRDLQYILGIVTMALQYLTPVMYGADMVPEKYRLLFNLNPMTPIISIYRDILYWKVIPDMGTLLYSATLGVVAVVAGYFIFNRLQRGFAENV